MWAQCDLDGNQHILMDSIVDSRKNGDAVSVADKYFIKNGRQYPQKTTKGWQLCILWKDGSISWEKLASMKDSFPVEVAKYVEAQGIDHEPAFSWWVPYILKKRDRIIVAVNKRYHKRIHKFGIRVPKTVEEAKLLDQENGNTM